MTNFDCQLDGIWKLTKSCLWKAQWGVFSASTHWDVQDPFLEWAASSDSLPKYEKAQETSCACLPASVSCWVQLPPAAVAAPSFTNIWIQTLQFFYMTWRLTGPPKFSRPSMSGCCYRRVQSHPLSNSAFTASPVCGKSYLLQESSRLKFKCKFCEFNWVV